MDGMSTKRIAGPEIERLIQLLAKVPGLGPRSARRAALHLIKKKEQLLGPLAAAMADAEAKVRVCSTCGNVDTSDPCMICTDQRRDGATIIVVEDVSDLWALERAGAMNVRFHVLGGTLSPLDGVGPDQLNIRQLIGRVAAGGVTEIIIAVNATVEGQTTAHYLIDDLSHFSVKVTRLAHGVPVGGELDYLDEGTLAAALKSRTAF
jgi:recombination protein RecR